MSKLKFVVTGTGRSGSVYASRLFSAAGLKCGHEDVFTEKPGLWDKAAPRKGGVARLKEPFGRVKQEHYRANTDFDGDSSWMAAPRLARFDGLALLQLRHPVPVIRSFMGIRFFSEPHKTQRRYAAAHFEMTGDDMVDAMRWWVYWNELADEHADLTYRLEDFGSDLLAEILQTLSVEDPEAKAAAALEACSNRANSSQSRGTTPGKVGWGDLPEGRAKDAIREAAEKWGYDPADPLFGLR